MISLASIFCAQLFGQPENGRIRLDYAKPDGKPQDITGIYGLSLLSDCAHLKNTSVDCRLTEKLAFTDKGSYTFEKLKDESMYYKELGEYRVSGKDSVEFTNVVFYQYEDPFCVLDWNCMGLTELKKRNDLTAEKNKNRLKKYMAGYQLESNGQFWFQSKQNGSHLLSRKK